MDYLRLLNTFTTEDKGGIRLHAVSQALAEAVTEEVTPISSAQVNHLWMQVLGLAHTSRADVRRGTATGSNVMQLVADRTDDFPLPEMEIAIGVAGSLWGRFSRQLAKQIGLTVADWEECDAWASSERPKCRTTTRAMRDVLYGYISAECPQLEYVAAIPAEEVLFANVGSARSVDQTYRRLAYSRFGLQVVS